MEDTFHRETCSVTCSVATLGRGAVVRVVGKVLAAFQARKRSVSPLAWRRTPEQAFELEFGMEDLVMPMKKLLVQLSSLQDGVGESEIARRELHAGQKS
jgi:hypothetical protein